MDFRYWDANVFLGWLADEPDKVSRCRPVIDAAQAGQLVVITSALTIAEVLWVKGEPRLPVTEAKRVEAFFRNRWIIVRDVDRFIAEDARALVWDKNIKPKDAIHVATALRQDVQIDQLDTFDEGLIKQNGKLGVPPLAIGVPNLPGKLPFDSDDEDKDGDG